MRRGHIGKLGENIAQQHYIQLGFSIISKNFTNRIGKQRGEIDFIALKQKSIVFVEVKTRSTSSVAYSSAVESVNAQKQQKLRKTLNWFLMTHPEYTDYLISIDVCVIILDNGQKYVKIISNAVEDLY